MKYIVILLTCGLAAVNCRKPRPEKDEQTGVQYEFGSGIQPGEHWPPLGSMLTIDSGTQSEIVQGLSEQKWIFRASKEDLIIKMSCFLDLSTRYSCREEGLVVYDGISAKILHCGKKNFDTNSGTGLLFVTYKTRYRKKFDGPVGKFHCSVNTDIRLIYGEAPIPESSHAEDCDQESEDHYSVF